MAPSIDPHPQAVQAPPHSKSARLHPYAPLSAEEITYASSLLKKEWQEGTDIQFKSVTLAEPPKEKVLSYLEAESKNASLPPIARQSFISYYLRGTNKAHEAVVDLSEGKVERNVRLGKNEHGSGDAEEIMLMEKIALEDEGVKKELEKLKLPEGAVVVCDPWIYGKSRVQGGDSRGSHFS